MYTRFAIYYLPVGDPLAEFGANWLGWDVNTGRTSNQFELAGLDAVTAAPRKYGFHGTLKPPFRLAPDRSPDALEEAVGALAERLRPADCEGLELAVLGRFLALIPVGDMSGIARLAASCLSGLDPFRAPPIEAELAKRRGAGLSAAQERLLSQWGYPYVLEEFRFHLTLTGPLKADQIDPWRALAASCLPVLPMPFVLDKIALVGERLDGNFELVRCYPLSG